MNENVDKANIFFFPSVTELGQKETVCMSVHLCECVRVCVSVCVFEVDQ